MVLAATSFLMDQLIRVVFDFADQRIYAAANPSAAERLGVVATGGYGRGELAPLSDIDLLFLRPYKQTPRGEQIVEFMLYLLWDMGLKVGHATRTVDESLRYADRDQTIRTALLEARYVWGDRALFDELNKGFTQKFLTGDGRDFVEAKLAERDQRHQRMGDSRYVVEPNVKEGKGGLRDLHLLFWIAEYLYRVSEPGELVAKGVLTQEEARHFERAERFLTTVRCHIHYLTGRADDRLSFDLQREIAARLGYQDRPGSRGVERFTKHYYLHAKTVGDLTRIFVAALEDSRRRKPKLAALWQTLRPRELEGFRLDGERLAVASPDAFTKDPVAILRLFHVAQENDLDIHPATLRLITQNIRLVDRLRTDPEANRLFMEMMTSRHDPETTLRRLNEAGVFGRFVPDFGRVVAQTQHDMYHTYTVDEHTIRAIGILAQDRERHAQGRPSAVGRRGAQDPVAAGALSRHPAARHRQGPRRRSLGAGRRRRDVSRAAAGLERRRDRDRGLAGALPPRNVQHRLPARPDGPQDHRHLRRPGAIARAAAAPAGVDGVRHPRRRPQCVERLEGRPVAPALQRHRARPVGRHPGGRPRRAHQGHPGRASPSG